MTFSPGVERVLAIAFREAAARRHTHVTVEHLLFVLVHDPEGEKIMAACGGDVRVLSDELARFLETGMEKYPESLEAEPDQTLAFRRVLQIAVLHVQSAGRAEVRLGDILAAVMQQPKTRAAQLLASQGITRLDVLNYISHGISKVPISPSMDGNGPEGMPGTPGAAGAGAGPEGPARANDPLGAYTLNLTAEAQAGRLDPLIGRTRELGRTMEILCRRRKNNPVFVGEAGVGKTALAEGLALRLLGDGEPVPKPLCDA